ncbi:unnamed protein product, partial [Ixodes pacificus]
RINAEKARVVHVVRQDHRRQRAKVAKSRRQANAQRVDKRGPKRARVPSQGFYLTGGRANPVESPGSRAKKHASSRL